MKEHRREPHMHHKVGGLGAAKDLAKMTTGGHPENMSGKAAKKMMRDLV